MGLNFPPGLKVDFLLCWTRLKGLALDTDFRFWPLVSPSVFSGVFGDKITAAHVLIL